MTRLSFIFVLVLGVAHFSQVAAARSQANYDGEQQRLTSQCTYAETARVQIAARALGVCLDVHMDDVKEALLLQRQHGNLLGGIDLEQITACWQAQEDEKSSPACSEELARFDEKASSHDGSPASKIASKLRDHPDVLCACIEAIDVSGIGCKGWGVVSARVSKASQESSRMHVTCWPPSHLLDVWLAHSSFTVTVSSTHTLFCLLERNIVLNTI